MTQRQIVIPTLRSMGRGLINHDEKSKNYRAVELLPPDATIHNKAWVRGAAYDQDGTSECVPNTGKGMMNTQRMSSKYPYRKRSQFNRHDWYLGAQRNDEWDGEAYDGTSGLGLCRYLKSIGVIESYHHTFGLEEALLTLSNIGPLGIGVWWKNSMWATDANGFLNISGSNVGGHEVEILKNNYDQRYVEGINSWGPDWGKKGRFKLKYDDFGALLEDQGDSFVITG